MQKINLDQVLIDWEGKPICEDGNEKPATLRYIICMGLSQRCHAAVDEKYWRAMMVRRVAANKEADILLTPPEVARLRDALCIESVVPDVVFELKRILVPQAAQPDPHDKILSLPGKSAAPGRKK